MARNLIGVLARGNQELFHSAFFAWLFTKDESHGFGSAVLEAFLSLLGLQEPGQEYKVVTEHRVGHCRFDIFIQSTAPGLLEKGLIIENKTKSSGDFEQLRRYQQGDHKVVALTLLPWTFDDVGKCRFQVVPYQKILDILGKVLSEHRSGANPYQFLVEEYVKYLNQVLGVFGALSRYSRGERTLGELTAWITRASPDVFLNSNDVRTLNDHYHREFAGFLSAHRPQLVFGDCKQHQEARESGRNTHWIPDKSKQSGPFILAHVRDFSAGATRFRLDAALSALHSEKPITLVPRIEIRLSPDVLTDGATDEKTPVGRLLFGLAGEDERVDRLLRTQEPYKSVLKRQGTTNFHKEEVSLGEIRFSRLADRVRSMMEKIGRFQ